MTETNRAVTALALGAGVGAGLTYFLDRHRGSRRRAHLRNQVRHASYRVRETARVPLRRLQALARVPVVARVVRAMVPQYVLELRS